MGGSFERLIGGARRILDTMFLDQHTCLTHEVLCTMMAEVITIINARPLVPVSNDTEEPFILSPSMLLTQKVGAPPPPGDFTDKDLLTKQWRQVEALANRFWKAAVNRICGVVLLKDNQSARNDWAIAVVKLTIPGSDVKVRKMELKTTDQGQLKTFPKPSRFTSDYGLNFLLLYLVMLSLTNILSSGFTGKLSHNLTESRRETTCRLSFWRYFTS